MALGRLVTAAGSAAGRVMRWSRSVPGIAGAGLMSYAAALVYLPAGLAAGAVFLLLLDRRL